MEAGEQRVSSLLGPARPTHICDIVMKGGITSGVVYPLAVVELSKTYTFKNIGGTSAGAIAAAATAAAEFGRQNGVPDSFSRLAEVPGWLAQDNHLFSLFEPSSATRPVFELLSAWVRASGKLSRCFRVAWACFLNFPVPLLLGLLPGLILAAICWGALTGREFLYCMVCSAVLAFMVSLSLAACAVYRRAVSTISTNFYGLCSGFNPACNSELSLTGWLSSLIDNLAGKKDDQPLTFGDLWGTDSEQAEEDSSNRIINLQMMTTNLGHGRPYKLPFETKAFYFDPQELAQLFPTEVVNWMVSHACASVNPTPTTRNGQKLVPLPLPSEVPVVVAARMSLSFPLLISAVPLYCVDFTRIDNQKKTANGEPPEAEKCWFSDGGICSNFPVHFFDQALPRWPTFAISLKPFHPDHTSETDSVWMPSSHLSGWSESWIRFDHGSGIDRMTGFLAAILNTMQNWMDNLQSKIPGYRDRIVHISHSDQEGGLNLSMPPDVVTRLSQRGRVAGSRLRERFSGKKADPAELSWDHHRWIRYRSTMAVLEEFLKRFQDAYENPQAGDNRFEELICLGSNDPPGSYRWDSPKQMEKALKATKDLVDLARRWADEARIFGPGAPRPAPDLRIRPRI